MNRDKIYHHQQQQVEENMSNLTSASGDQASVSSGNRTETSGSNIHPNTQQQEQYFVQQSSLKRKRNQPGNPGLFYIIEEQRKIGKIPIFLGFIFLDVFILIIRYIQSSIIVF